MLKCSNEAVRRLSKVLKNQSGSNCENVRRSARENTTLIIMIMMMVIIMTMIMTMIMMVIMMIMMMTMIMIMTMTRIMIMIMTMIMIIRKLNEKLLFQM